MAAAAIGTALAGQFAGLPPGTLLFAAAAAPLVAGVAGFALGADRPFVPARIR